MGGGPSDRFEPESGAHHPMFQLWESLRKSPSGCVMGEPGEHLPEGGCRLFFDPELVEKNGSIYKSMLLNGKENHQLSINETLVKRQLTIIPWVLKLCILGF